jgi:hypothetical protein
MCKTLRITLPVSDASTEQCEVMPATPAVGIGQKISSRRSALCSEVLQIPVLNLKIRAM